MDRRCMPMKNCALTFSWMEMKGGRCTILLLTLEWSHNFLEGITGPATTLPLTTSQSYFVRLRYQNHNNLVLPVYGPEYNTGLMARSR